MSARIQSTAVVEGVVALISAAAAKPGDSGHVDPRQLGVQLAECACADPFVSETLGVASSLIAKGQNDGAAQTRTDTALVESLPLFAYYDDDGTVRVVI
jgi:hypothetical protein